MDEKVREFIDALNLKDFQEAKPYEYLSKLKGSSFELKQAQVAMEQRAKDVGFKGFKSMYARDLYQRLARPVEEIPRQEQYICRGERAGIIYDKRAMQAVSKMLGHARLDVVTSYLK